MTDLSSVLDHFINKSLLTEASFDFLAWMWTQCSFISLKTTLGKKLISCLLANHRSLACLSLINEMIKDPVGSGLSLSNVDDLFEHCIEFLLDDKFDDDSYIASLIECVVSGGCSSIPSYMSPRLPFVIRIIDMIAHSNGCGLETIKACQRALVMIEKVIHPVRPLEPVVTAMKIRRQDAIQSSFTCAVKEDVNAVVEDVKEVKALQLNFNIPPPVPIVASTPNAPSVVNVTDYGISGLEEPVEQKPEFTSAPNLFVKETPRSIKEEEDDEPIPELIL